MTRFMITCIMLVGAINALTGQGIVFEKSGFEEAVAKASAENKIMFVDVYADWCKPCKWMEKEVFNDPEVGELFNKNFINIRLDAESEIGKSIAQKYLVSGYPTLIFINAKQELLYKLVGFHSPEELISEGIFMSSPGNLAKMEIFEKRFKSGNRDKNFLLEYLRLSHRFDKVRDTVFFAFFETLSFLDFQNEEYLDLISHTIPYAHCRPFELVYDYYEVIRSEEDSDPEKVYHFELQLEAAIDRTASEAIQSGDSSMLAYAHTQAIGLEKLKDTVTAHMILRQQEYNWLSFYEKVRDANAYAKLANMLMNRDFVVADSLSGYPDTLNAYLVDSVKYYGEWDTYQIESAEILNHTVEQYLQFYNDTNYLKEAIRWETLAIKWDPKPMYKGTLAKVLYATGNKTEAISVARKAMEAAKKNGEETRPLERILFDFVRH